jgi:hypothetical protein
MSGVLTHRTRSAENSNVRLSQSIWSPQLTDLASDQIYARHDAPSCSGGSG